MGAPLSCRLVPLVLGLSAWGCGTAVAGCAAGAVALEDVAPAPREPEPPEPPPSSEPKVEQPPPEERVVTIEPGKVVPSFRVTAENGAVHDSRELVGRQPFVLVFFASWCTVCEKKLPALTQTLAAEAGSLVTIGVAMDTAESWSKVDGYVARHGLAFDIVRGESHKRFVTAYDPFSTVPLVIVVDKNGIIAELQRGHKDEHVPRLAEALRAVQQP
jgi:peroxiredoxin